MQTKNIDLHAIVMHFRINTIKHTCVVSEHRDLAFASGNTHCCHNPN